MHGIKSYRAIQLITDIPLFLTGLNLTTLRGGLLIADFESWTTHGSIRRVSVFRKPGQ